MLDQPTGRPLYSYKIKPAEYEQLKDILTRSSLYIDRHTAAYFVLFAAEWWRRHYESGHWQWEPIFETIGKQNWNTAQKHKQLTKEGCAYWKRSIFQTESGFNQYLGTMFAEAGLPVRLLTAEGYTRTLLVKSFAFLAHNQVNDTDALVLIGQQAERLVPPVLNNPSFHTLIYGVVTALLDLKKTYALTNQEQPVAFLNESVPDWRNRLPVRLDDGPNGGKFIDELLNDVVKLARPQALPISVSYQLLPLANGYHPGAADRSPARIKTVLNIPNGHYTAEDLQLPPDAFSDLPAIVKLKILFGDSEEELGTCYRHGDTKLSVGGLKARQLPRRIHENPWQVVLASEETDEQWPISLPYSDGLDPSLSWVFAAKNDGLPELKGVGSVRLSAHRATVICPKTCRLTGEGATYRGEFSDTQAVYDLTADCELYDADEDQTFKIRLAQPQDDDVYFALYPQSNAHQLTVCPQQNAGIFLGFPRVRKRSKQHGWQLDCTEQVQYKSLGKAGWQLLTGTGELAGRFRVRCLGSDNEVLFSREVSVLPPAFRIRFDEPNRSLLFDNMGNLRLSVGADTGAIVAQENEQYRLTFAENPPISNTLTVRFSSSDTRPIDLHVPSSITPAMFTDATGKPMGQGQPTDVQGLYGARLLLTNPTVQTQSRQISLTLTDRHNTDAGSMSRRKTVQLPPFSNRQIALISYRDDIERLLSFTSSVDGIVRVQHNHDCRIDVAQYCHKTRYDPQIGLITIAGNQPDLSKIPLRAFPLYEPFDADKLLTLNVSEPGWTFPPDTDAGGVWFYFADKTAPEGVRPAVAILGEMITPNTSETVDFIHEATDHTYQDRQTVLTDLFDRIADDFGNANWQTLQNLAKHTAHLPMNALDVWVALAKSDRGLVSLFLQFDTELVGRLSRAFAVRWQSIPVTVWLDVFGAYQTYLTATIPESMTYVVADLIERKAEELEKLFSLNSLSQLIGLRVMGKPVTPELQICQLTGLVQGMLQDEVMGGGEGKPGLPHRHTNSRFPVHLNPEISKAFNSLPVPVKSLLPELPANFGHVRPVAYLPVLLAYQSVCPDELRINGWDRHRVAQLIEFDPTFFNIVFNLVQAHCWLTLNP